MLDPVVIPLPVAVALVAALAAAAWAYRHWLEADPTPWAVTAPPAPSRPTPGRHRLAAAAEPYRPQRAPLLPEPPPRVHYDRTYYNLAVQHGWKLPGADYRQPLIAGHDDRATEQWPAGMFGLSWETDELAIVR